MGILVMKITAKRALAAHPHQLQAPAKMEIHAQKGTTARLDFAQVGPSFHVTMKMYVRVIPALRSRAVCILQKTGHVMTETHVPRWISAMERGYAMGVLPIATMGTHAPQTHAKPKLAAPTPMWTAHVMMAKNASLVTRVWKASVQLGIFLRVTMEMSVPRILVQTT